jgi:hypothetical protein
VTEDEQSLYQRIKSRRFHDRDLRFKDLANTNSGGVFALYISFFGVLAPYNSIRRKLFESFVAFLEEQAEITVRFSELFARPQTDPEALNMSALGMKPLHSPQHSKKDDGKFGTYFVSSANLVKRPLFRKCANVLGGDLTRRPPG